MLSFPNPLNNLKQLLTKKPTAKAELADDVETYFECVSSCDLDDKECESDCVDELRNGNQRTSTS